MKIKCIECTHKDFSWHRSHVGKKFDIEMRSLKTPGAKEELDLFISLCSEHYYIHPQYCELDSSESIYDGDSVRIRIDHEILNGEYYIARRSSWGPYGHRRFSIFVLIKNELTEIPWGNWILV